jgi:uncharacterized linocin/CFP29 family protein
VTVRPRDSRLPLGPLIEAAVTAFRRGATVRAVVEVRRPLARSTVVTEAATEFGIDGDVLSIRGTGREPEVELSVEFSVPGDGFSWDIEPAMAAAETLAAGEDGLILDGCRAAGIAGIGDRRGPQPCTRLEDYPEVAARAVRSLRTAGVAGPFALLLDPLELALAEDTVVGRRTVAEELRRIVGRIHAVPVVVDPVVLPLRGGGHVLHAPQRPTLRCLGRDADGLRCRLSELVAFTDATGDSAVRIRRERPLYCTSSVNVRGDGT